MPETSEKPTPTPTEPKKKRHSFWRIVAISLGFLIVMLVAARLALPSVLRWYVNRTIDRNPLYDGKISDIEVHLWRGAYTITDIQLIKTTGNVPVPLFSAKRMDLAIEWNALLSRKIVGRILIEQPELNFVDAPSDSEDQTGAGGPWLEIVRDLFPFKINSCIIRDGSIHFRAFHKNPPVDLYLSHLDAQIKNLTNIHDEITPLVATVDATATAMDQAKFEYHMKLNPFSYRPTFQLAVRLLGLDVTQTNALARAYGAFDFEKGYFDLVVELDAKEGMVEGYVKPLFRNIKVFSLSKDIKEDNPLELFWEALVGVATQVFKNQPHDQFGTQIPLRGDLSNPQTDILATIGNILRNAFVRAYLPRLEGGAPDVDWLRFEPPSLESER
ncbi:MAG TPA: DUF748 domain-containing protein [Tepidisphaeraceae bacterium]|nr:DUF748 domain-containing protein [Tepidisphaeraceae bacterium]